MSNVAMSSQKRVLQVFGSLDRGGAESMLISLYNNVDRNNVQFDFLVPSRMDNYAFEADVMALGGRVYKSPKFNLKNLFSYCWYFVTLLNDHPEWQVIHFHYLSSSIALFPLAKWKKRLIIAHSHTSGMDKNFKSFARLLTQLPARFLSDQRLSCSEDAAAWMFGKKVGFIKLLNGVDLDKFHFSKKKGIRVRDEFKIAADACVIGHVGRFSTEKNHSFVLDVFKDFLCKNDKGILLLVGDGVLRCDVESKAKHLGVLDKVVFSGVRSDVDCFLSAMDIMLFPSLHEGLPVTLVEAQANGLPCLVSDAVSSSAKLTRLVEFMSLDAESRIWSHRLSEIENDDKERVAIDFRNDLTNAGYDVKDNARWLERFYLSLMEKA